MNTFTKLVENNIKLIDLIDLESVEDKNIEKTVDYALESTIKHTNSDIADRVREFIEESCEKINYKSLVFSSIKEYLKMRDSVLNHIKQHSEDEFIYNLEFIEASSLNTYNNDEIIVTYDFKLSNVALPESLNKEDIKNSTINGFLEMIVGETDSNVLKQMKSYSSEIQKGYRDIMIIALHRYLGLNDSLKYYNKKKDCEWKCVIKPEIKSFDIIEEFGRFAGPLIY